MQYLNYALSALTFQYKYRLHSSANTMNFSAASASQDDESERSHNPPLQQLQLAVALNNMQLLELISNDQKFVERIVMYNQNGVDNIGGEDYERALVYLQEGEKILEYAASCGKTIDRFLIISTLHNEACAYQKLWQLQKSSDYLEAIIFNMSTYLEQVTPFQALPELRDSRSDAHVSLSTNLNRRLATSVYHLQYSAVSSRVGRHDVAIESAKRCLGLLSEILADEFEYESFILERRCRDSQIRRLLEKSRRINKKTLPTLIEDCRSSLADFRRSSESAEVDPKLRKFSISEVMQIEPLTCEKANQILPIDNFISSFGLIQTALYVSIAYYAIATELRLNQNSDQNILNKRQQLEQSKVYHLHAIRIAIDFVPCVTDYLEHIVNSFKNNYQVDLSEGGANGQYQLDCSLIEGCSFLANSEIEVVERKSEHSHRAQVMKQPGQFFGKTFTIHKHEPKPDQFYLRQKKKKSTSKRQKINSISSTSKLKDIPHALSKDRIRKESRIQLTETEGLERKSSHKYITVKQTLKRDKKLKSGGHSQEKTKDQSKKLDEKKPKQQKRISEEYLGEMKREKTKEQKKQRRGSKSGNKIKVVSMRSGSKDRLNFLSPKGGKATSRPRPK